MAKIEAAYDRIDGVIHYGYLKGKNQEFNAHLKNENSQKRSHKMVMKGRITYE